MRGVDVASVQCFPEQPRPGLGAVRPQTPAFDGAGEAATLWEGLSAALIGGVPALLDEVGLILGPVAPEYAQFLITARPEGAVAAEAAMVAFVEHAQRCPAPITARAGAVSALLPDTVTGSQRTIVERSPSLAPDEQTGGHPMGIYRIR